MLPVLWSLVDCYGYFIIESLATGGLIGVDHLVSPLPSFCTDPEMLYQLMDMC